MKATNKKVFIVIGEYEEYIESNDNIDKSFAVEGVTDSLELAIELVGEIKAEWVADDKELSVELPTEIATEYDNCARDRVYIVEQYVMKK